LLGINASRIFLQMRSSRLHKIFFLTFSVLILCPTLEAKLIQELDHHLAINKIPPGIQIVLNLPESVTKKELPRNSFAKGNGPFDHQLEIYFSNGKLEALPVKFEAPPRENYVVKQRTAAKDGPFCQTTLSQEKAFLKETDSKLIHLVTESNRVTTKGFLGGILSAVWDTSFSEDYKGGLFNFNTIYCETDSTWGLDVGDVIKIFGENLGDSAK
jgi:hypothetical protein